MAFHPGDLPPAVHPFFNDPNLPTMNDLYWAAVNAGVTNTDTLTDMLFCKYNMGMIGKTLKPGMPDYEQLVEEWKFYNAFVLKNRGGRPKSKGSSVWSLYKKSNYPDSSYLSPAAKKWLAKKPKHDREAAIIQSNRMDNGKPLIFFAWKTQEPRLNCMDHNLHEDEALHGQLELVTSLSGVKTKHKLKSNVFSILGNDCGAKGIAAMNLLVNELMFIYVFRRGMCVRRANSTAWRKAREDGKATFEYIHAFLGVAGGAKPSGGKPGIPAKPHKAPQQLSELNWKGYSEQISKIYKGEFGKSSSVAGKTIGLRIDEEIREGGEIIGAVRHFD